MNPVTSKVVDSRRTPLSALARDERDVIAESLKRVLPEPAISRLPVAAFTSSI
jgi:FXSXX-COOH protein